MAELDDILGAFLGGDEKKESTGGESEIFDILLKVMPLLETVNKESDDERLLKALTPYMSDVRKEKLDTAQSLLKLVKILPLLGQVFGGGEK